jgi:hypothetical protein
MLAPLVTTSFGNLSQTEHPPRITGVKLRIMAAQAFFGIRFGPNSDIAPGVLGTDKRCRLRL